MKTALIFALVLFLGSTSCAKQSDNDSPLKEGTSVDQDSEATQQESGETQTNSPTKNPALSKIPTPTKKACHPKGYYDLWLVDLEPTEKVIESMDADRHTKTWKHWNRFISYFKMIPDDQQDILLIFMDAYKFDKHSFCAKYDKWIPRLTAGEFAYCLDHYQAVKPVMDEIVRLVLDSYDKKLVEQFAEIMESDQSIRANIPDNATPEKRKELLAQQRKIDIENLKQIEQVIAAHGYPGRSLVGTRYEEVAFLVIQHSGGEVIEKYLPSIKSAIERNDLKPGVYPYLFDRLEVSKGRPQHFGTQSKLEDNELFPIHDPENLNKRRQQFGLPPISLPDGNGTKLK